MEQWAMGALDRNTAWGGRGGDAGATHGGEEVRRSYVWLETNDRGGKAVPARTVVATARQPWHAAALAEWAAWDAATVGQSSGGEG